MKKLLVSIFLVLSFAVSFGQAVTQRSSPTITVQDSRWMAKFNAYLPRYADTTAANVDIGIDSCGAIIFCRNTNSLWYRQCNPKMWVAMSSGGITFTILNDTTIIICSQGNNLCDTSYIYNQIGIPDTIYAELPLWIDTTGGIKTLKILRDDGLISGGVVTYSGTGLIYDVTSAVYQINYQQYTSPAMQVTLSASDPTFSTQYLFVVDTNGVATFIRGDPAALPLTPQVDGASQLALTQGITILAGATTPDVTTDAIWDENLGAPSEWTFSTTGTITKNANNTDNPKHLTKAIFVSSYNNNSRLNFLSATTDSVGNGQVLRAWIYLNGSLGTRAFRFQWFNGNVAASNSINVSNTFGLNSLDSNEYQLVAIPLTAFIWTSQTYNTLRITMVGTDNSGAKGYYIDWIELQTGTSNVNTSGEFWALNGNSINSSNFLGTTNNTPIRFRTNNIQGMVLDSLGNVGIGTLTPQAHFHLVERVQRSFRGYIAEQNTNDTHSSGMQFLKSRGTYESPLTIVDGDYGGGFGFWHYLSTGYKHTLMGVSRVRGTVTSTSAPTDFVLAFDSLGIAGDEPFNANAVKFIFTSQGVLGIGNMNINPSNSSLLDISSTTRGALFPRMTAVQRNAIATPAKGLLVFDNDSSSLFQYTGSVWQNLYNIVSGGGGGTVTTVSDLSPLFTTSNPTTTPTFVLSNASAYTLFGRASGTGVPSYLASIDSNWVPALHTELYYNTKYAGIGTVSGINALTGDVTASGTGSVAATLATVNSNVGSFTNASITVNAKGLITAASSGSAGGTTDYQTATATAAQTAFTFSSVPASYNDYWLDINGSVIAQSFYTTSSNTVTFTAGLVLNDKVGFHRVK